MISPHYKSARIEHIGLPKHPLQPIGLRGNFEDEYTNKLIPLNQQSQSILEELNNTFSVLQQQRMSHNPNLKTLKKTLKQLTLPSVTLKSHFLKQSKIAKSKQVNQYQQQKLDERSTLIKSISNKITQQLSMDFNQLDILQRQKTQMEKVGKDLTKSKPSYLKRRRKLHLQSHELQQEFIKPYQQVGTLKIYWCPLNEQLWRPPVRESTCLASINKTIYMFGGKGAEIYGQLLALDFQSQKWKIIKLEGDKISARHGNTINSIKNSLFIIGGEIRYDKVHNIRILSGEIFKIDLDSRTCKHVKTNGQFLESRKHHASVVVGRAIMILGGLNEQLVPMSDCKVFNLGTNKLDSLQVSQPNPFEYGIAYHTMCSIFKNDKLRVTLYQRLDDSDSDENDEIQYQGIYVYGGIDSNQLQYNDLYVLRTTTQPAVWFKVPTKGIGPSPLTSHCMIHNEQYQYLIIYGGKIEQESTYYNQEIFILLLKNCVWLKTTQCGKVPEARAGHAVVNIDSKIIIFGGINSLGYASSQIQYLELDEEIAIQTITEFKNLTKDKSDIKHRQQHSIDSVMSSNSKIQKILKKQNREESFYQRRELIQELNQSSIVMKESILKSPVLSPKRTKNSVRFRNSSEGNLLRKYL